MGLKVTAFMCALRDGNTLGMGAAFLPSASTIASLTEINLTFRVPCTCGGISCLKHNRRRACVSHGRSKYVKVCRASTRHVFRCCIGPRTAKGHASIH